MEIFYIPPQGPTKPLETNRMPDNKCGGCGCNSLLVMGCEGSRVVKLKVCGSCNNPDRYCGKPCFRVDWKQHRVQCKQTCSREGCRTDFALLPKCKKYKCPCFNKRYCGPVCQKRDWNSGHKHECEKSLQSAMRAIRATLPSEEELLRRIPPGTSVEEYVGMMKQDFMMKYPRQHNFMTS
jgi:hypothetical protein